MASYLFTNEATTTVPTGGTTAPSSGSTETWTVTSSGGFPAASSSGTGTQFSVVDPALPTEIITVTNVSGATWTVTRGAEGSGTVAHTAGFTVVHVVSAGALNSFLQTGVDKIVNAKRDFGCVGDGVTDDTTNLQSFFTAIGQGGSKAGYLGYIPSGTYKVTSAIAGASLTRVMGAGKYQTTIKQFTNNQDTLQFLGTSGANMLGVEISDMTIQGPGKASGSTGIVLNLNYFLDTCMVKRIIVQQGGSHGVKLLNSNLISFEHVWHYNNGGDGLNASTSLNAVKWDNCEFFGNSGNGATMNGTAGSLIMGCDFETNGQHGLSVDNCYSLTVEGNDFENNGTSSAGTTYAAIKIDHTAGYSGPRIVGNNFTGTSGTTANGIELTGNVTSAYVEGNSFNNFALNDILIDSGATGVVLGANNVHQAGTPKLVTDSGTGTVYLGSQQGFWDNTDAGWKAASFDFLNTPNMAALSGMSNYTAGVIFGIRIQVRKPVSVSKLQFYWVQPTGGSPANCFAGIIDSTGTLVDKTADLTSTASGLITPSLAGGAHTLQTGYYYGVILIGTQGTTQGGVSYPTATLISGLGVGQSYGGLTASGYRCVKIGNLTSQTSLAGPYTLSSNVVSALPFGMAFL